MQKGGAIHRKIVMLTPNTKTYTLAADFHDKTAPKPLPTFGRAEPGSFIRFEKSQNITNPEIFAVRPSAVKTLQQIQQIS